MRTFQDAFETRKWFIIYQCFFNLHDCCIFKHIPNLVQHCHIQNSMHIENAAKDFAKIFNGLNFSQKRSVLDIWLGSEHDSVSISSTLHKIWSFPLRIFLVNVTKYAVSCGFGHIYWRNTWWKTSFFYAVKVTQIITRLIEIDIAPLTVLFCNYSLFRHCPLADLWLHALKRYQFQYNFFVGLVWLTSNYMSVSGDFGDKSHSWFLKNLKLPSFYSVIFKIFKNALGKFIPNLPPKYVITQKITDY